MSDEPNTEKKPKKVPPMALAGSGVAIAAAVVAVFISTSNKREDTAAPVEVAPGEIATIQSGSTPNIDTPEATASQEPAETTDIPEGEFAFSDETLSFAGTLPDGPANDPILRKLRAETQEHLDKAKTGAREDFVERKRMGAMEMAWDIIVSWKYTAKAGGIVSLVGDRYEFTGGAHGNSYTDTRIARTATGEELTVLGMMQPPRAPPPALVIGICEALKTEKLARLGSATIYDDPVVCAGPNANVNLEEAHLALAPSDQPDKFGGVIVYFDPYSVGPYVEGGYELVVPQDVFRDDLRKEFQPLFAGTPPKAPT